MSTEIRIPSIGFSTQEATLAEWMVADGGAAVKGEPLYALEMDKSTQEIEAPVSGTLMIKVEAGEVCEIGALIAEIV
jgi:pyruvate/2-oxoglutarate dehydrogenase complex dihydrolipoamide acyltransferase (E2) component